MTSTYLSRMDSFNRIILVSPFILPFLFHPLLPNSYEFPKFVAFVAITQLLFIFYLLKHFFKSRIFRQKLDSLSILILLFGCVVLFANIFGIDVKTSFLGSEYRHQGFITLVSGIVLFFLMREKVSGQKNILNWVCTVALVSAVVLSMYALWQWISFTIFHIPIPIYQGRIVATMGNPNFLGGYLVMLLPFILSNKKKSWRFVGIFFIITGILLSQSRSAILAAVIVGVLWFVNFRWNHVRMLVSSLIIIGIAGIVVSLTTYDIGKTKLSLDTQAAYCLYLIPDGGVKKVTFSVLEHMQPLLSRISFCEGRMAIWGTAVEAVKQRPFLGYGQENFELLFSSNYIKVDNAHNIFLEVLVSSGIIGFILFLSILRVVLQRAEKPVRLSLISFLIVASFNPLSISQIALFWLLLGLVRRSKEIKRQLFPL